MKFQVPSKTLYNATSAVSKVINSKNAITILNNFLLTLKDGILTVTGSDTENILSARVSVENAEGEGCFCLDARRLVELLREMPEKTIDFDIDDSNLAIEIRYPGGDYSLMGLNGDEFPLPKTEDADEQPINFVCPGEQLVKGIDNSLFAVGQDDFRPQMMGIYFDIKPEEIVFVATDTRKLVKYTSRMAAPGVTASCIMPVKASTIIKNVFGKSEEIQISMTSKRANLNIPNFTFSCPFIKGAFPAYDRVIPKSNPYTLIVDRQSLLNAVRRVGVFIDSGVGLVRFRITSDKVQLKSQDNNMISTAREDVPCSYDGSELVIGFSAPYLLEILNTLSTSDIVVKLSDPGRPGVFCPSEDEKDSQLVMLLMPMAIIDF